MSRPARRAIPKNSITGDLINIDVSIGGLRALYDSLVVVSVIDLDIYRTFTCIVSLLRAS